MKIKLAFLYIKLQERKTAIAEISYTQHSR